MRKLAAIGLLLFVPGLAGCDGSRSSTLPAAPLAPSPAAQPVPQPSSVSVSGWVYDSAFRILAGARVEILDGPHAGSSATTDSTGQFSLMATVDDATRFRATREGHVGSIGTLSPNCATCTSRYIYFYLAVISAPVDMAGAYTLTFVADSTCSGLPDELRTRTYAAKIAPGSNSHSPANTFYDASVSGAPFLANYASFPIGVAGDLVAFDLRGDGPYLVEQVAANTYIGFDGRAEAHVGTSPVSTIAASFQGSIVYCELPSPMGPYYDCRPGRAVAQTACESKNHRLILTRR